MSDMFYFTTGTLMTNPELFKPNKFCRQNILGTGITLKKETHEAMIFSRNNDLFSFVRFSFLFCFSFFFFSFFFRPYFFFFLILLFFFSLKFFFSSFFLSYLSFFAYFFPVDQGGG